MEPAAAQQLVAEYAALVEAHAAANRFPVSTAALPASKDTIKGAVRTVLEALVATGQLTGELTSFLEDTTASLANYVDEELAVLAAEHRRASEALEGDSRNPRERAESPNWTTVVRTSRLAGEIARASAEEAERLREEFRGMLAALG